MPASARTRTRPTDVYWAAVTRDEIADQVNGRCSDFFRTLHESGRMTRWRRAVEAYYGIDSDGQPKSSHRINFGGEQGELTLVKANHFRSLTRHILTMATADRVAWDARGINTDYETAAATQLAEHVLDYYLSEQGVEQEANAATEYAVLTAEGYVSVLWDVHAGEDHTTEVVTEPVLDENGQPALDEMGEPMMQPVLDEAGEPVERVIKTGDVRVRAHAPWMVVRDLTANPRRGMRWCVVREYANKWDLAAQATPEDAAEIISYGKDAPEEWDTDIWQWVHEARAEDDVEVRHFFHAKCEALPQGRYTVVCGSCVLFDGPNPYPDVGVYPMIPSVEMDAGTGYASAWDLLAIQQVSDSIVSTIITQHDAHGVQNILNPDGSNLSPEDFGNGLRVLTYNPNAGKPEALQLYELPKVSQYMLEWAKSTMEALSGINAVARGEDEASSGSHAALLAAQAMQFQSDTVGARTQLLRQIGTAIVDRLKEFASSPRIAEIVGKDQRHYLEQFTGQDLQGVRRVSVVEGNPATKTLAGRMEMADKLMERGLVKTFEQYAMVLETGRVEPLYEGDRAMMMTIRAENEALSNGEPAPTLITDLHHLHIQEHLAVLASPRARVDERISQAVLMHIQEHIELRKSMDPILAELTGQMPLASLAAMAGMPQGPGAPANDNAGPPVDPGEPANDNGNPEAAERMRVPGGPESVNGNKMPLMPENPMTGERAPAPEV